MSGRSKEERNLQLFCISGRCMPEQFWKFSLLILTLWWRKEEVVAGSEYPSAYMAKAQWGLAILLLVQRSSLCRDKLETKIVKFFFMGGEATLSLLYLYSTAPCIQLQTIHTSKSWQFWHRRTQKHKYYKTCDVMQRQSDRSLIHWYKKKPGYPEMLLRKVAWRCWCLLW